MHMCVHVCVHVCACVVCILCVCMCVGTCRRHVWKSEDSLLESILSFYPVGSGAQTQVTKLGGTHLYPVSHLNTTPTITFFLGAFMIVMF